MRKKIFIFVSLFIFAAVFFYFRNEIYFSKSGNNSIGIFEIKKGEGVFKIANNLEDSKIISNKLYFVSYVFINDMRDKIYPGKYYLGENLTIPEILSIISNPEKMFVNITFPEGWTARKMADRLSANGFKGEEFLNLVEKPSQELILKYPILKTLPKDKTLEGYLFPDTYSFAKESTTEKILEKIIDNTQRKITNDMLIEIENKKKNFFDIIIMASIIEGEVKTDADRKIVSGIFYNRLLSDMTLGSDATLEYIIGGNKEKHSTKETKIESPYNTYMYKGLPPGPVSNPGIRSIQAAINPAKTDYMYFLNNTETGETFFSKTFEEHIKNKQKNGL